MSQGQGDHIGATITGDVSGQVAVGKHIAQTYTSGGGGGLSDDERAQLAALFAALKARVAAEAPDDQRSSATERVDELSDALAGEAPDLNTVQYVKRWFLRKLPHLAGLVTSVLVHPIVGKLVQSAGDVAFAELVRVAEE